MVGRERAAVAAVVACSLLWGATFVVIRDSVSVVPPAALVFGRFAGATLVLAALAAWQRRRVTRDALVGGVVTGALGASAFLMQAIGLTTTSAGSSAFLTCVGTLFAAAFAWPVLGERPTLALLAGIGVALAGSALMSLQGGMQLGSGDLWTLAGALSFALQIALIGRWARRTDPVVLTAVQGLTTTLLLSGHAREALHHLGVMAPDARWRFAYLVLAGSALAPLLQVWALRVLPPGRVGLLLALEPVFALLFALTLGGERFVLRWWLGAALILAAVVWVETRPSRAPASSPPSTA